MLKAKITFGQQCPWKSLMLQHMGPQRQKPTASFFCSFLWYMGLARFCSGAVTWREGSIWWMKGGRGKAQELRITPASFRMGVKHSPAAEAGLRWACEETLAVEPDGSGRKNLAPSIQRPSGLRRFPSGPHKESWQRVPTLWDFSSQPRCAAVTGVGSLWTEQGSAPTPLY